MADLLGTSVMDEDGEFTANMVSIESYNKPILTYQNLGECKATVGRRTWIHGDERENHA